MTIPELKVMENSVDLTSVEIVKCSLMMVLVKTVQITKENKVKKAKNVDPMNVNDGI